MSFKLFTVFTPTHNRAHLLKRLYHSLLKQTEKDFKWLVIDDGSCDDTKEVITGFINEGIIDIEYHFIEKGFLYKAMKKSAELAESKYIIRIDDDDELTENCLEVFKSEWDKIESEGIDDIGEIRALSILDDGMICGNYQPQIGQSPIDTNYIERHLNNKARLENIACRKVSIWKQLFYDDDKWLFEKVNFVLDTIYWYRLSRLCRSRYIFVGLRIYHETMGSLVKTFNKLTIQNLYNIVFSNYILLNDNTDLFWKNPLYFIKILYKYAIYGFRLNLDYCKLFKTLKSNWLRILFVLFTPIFYMKSRNIKLS